MLEEIEKFYSQVGKSPKVFLIYSFIAILFFSGMTFTFMIPGLKGYSLYFMTLTLLMYFVVANIFVGLFKERVWFVLMICLLLSSLGMSWRLWLEWGEYSLVEHMNPAVYFGYPSVIALINTLFYSISSAMCGRKVD